MLRQRHTFPRPQRASPINGCVEIIRFEFVGSYVTQGLVQSFAVIKHFDVRNDRKFRLLREISL
jgi:hypothetical protein